MDERARLAELVAVYDSPQPEERLPLLDEMDRLGGRRVAHALAGSRDPQERRLAARLMHLLPGEDHAFALEPLVRDPDPGVAAAARRALRGQVRTAEWRSVVTALAEGAEAGLRDEARVWLSDGAAR